jgi:hypothetical protein
LLSLSFNVLNTLEDFLCLTASYKSTTSHGYIQRTNSSKHWSFCFSSTILIQMGWHLDLQNPW